MKKLISALIIVIGLIGVWWFSSYSAPSGGVVSMSEKTASPEHILANDFEKITRNLNPENMKGQEWKLINNYSLQPSEVVKKDTAAAFFKSAAGNIPDIYSCLKKDFCGMETRNENDAYFDEQGTPAHILINRNLKIMKESLRKDEALKSQVDWELMQELATSGQDMLSVEALDIIREFDTEGMKTDDLIKLSEGYKGTAKADALVRIASQNKASDKLLVANDIKEVFASSDNDTVISVLEKLKSMSFSSNDLAKILVNLCHYKENPAEERNWKMIKYEAAKIYPEFEKLCN